MQILSTKEFRAITYLIGITIGAGILALPYAFAQTGFLLGLTEMVIVWVIVTLLTLYIGEVVLRTNGNHEIAGLTGKYLGEKGKVVIVGVSILYIYGALVAYGIGLGQAAESLFSFPQLHAAIVMFLGLAALVYFGLEIVTKSEVLLTPFIFLIIVAIFFSGYEHIAVQNLETINMQYFFLPFGPLFFALLGFWCVPDMKRILGSKNRNKLRKTIILGTSLTAISYLLFTVVVLGITGAETSQLFSVSLSAFLGPTIIKVMHLFTIFAIVTSFLGLAFTLKAIFTIDYKLSNIHSWLATFTIPFILLFFIKGSFIDVITITGAAASVFVLTTIVLMFHKAKKKGDRKPEFELHVPKWINALIIAFCVGVALYTVCVYGGRLM
jgi:tyrosine-specific transport protein